MSIAIVSGYFNPLLWHHIKYFNAAKNYGAVLAIVNNDDQVRLKGSYEFLPENERLNIVSSIKSVSYARLSIDKDSSVVETLKEVLKDWKNTDIWLCNGGDRQEGKTSTEEEKFCNENGIKLAYNVGGGKTGSSSETLQKFLDKYWDKEKIDQEHLRRIIRGTSSNINPVIVDEFENPFSNIRYSFQQGCIDRYQCDKCNKIYICDTNKAKENIVDGNIAYISGPCACGYRCPNCYPNGYASEGWYSGPWSIPTGEFIENTIYYGSPNGKFSSPEAAYKASKEAFEKGNQNDEFNKRQ